MERKKLVLVRQSHRRLLQTLEGPQGIGMLGNRSSKRINSGTKQEKRKLTFKENMVQSVEFDDSERDNDEHNEDK